MRISMFGAALLSLGLAQAQASGPEPVAPEAPIAAPQDISYPGTIRLSVDATDLAHHIFRAHETIPVAKAGPLTLLYPQWIPGAHSPIGQIDKFSGVVIRANGKRLEWTRDPVEVCAFHVDVPEGVAALDIDMQFDSPVTSPEGRVMMTPDMLSLQWWTQLLYPAGYFSRDIAFSTSVKLPAGWQFGTALETASASGDTTTFKDVMLDTLVDSPMIAGRNFERVDLDPHGPAPVHLDVIADLPEQLVIPPAALAAHRALVAQTYKLFGSHHYNHYDFLFSLSDKMGGNGLEHHQSSEDGTRPRYFLDWDSGGPGRDLLSHEYTHSWDGKFRRPADLWTPNFNVPMRDSLLWVYEGQTQYWGYVLAARSGLMSHQQALDAIAIVAATYDHHVGRAWKNLEDTTNDPIVAQRRPIPWRNWQRSEDYYSEGQLVWFDADTLIRNLSGGKKSLDDFAKHFFGIDNGSYVTVTYSFDDVVKAMNDVQPYDWAKFLHDRLDGHANGAPLDGLTRGGYRLVYTDKPSLFEKGLEKQRKNSDFSFSLGITVGEDGVLSDVFYDSPAFAAGLTEGDKIVAVNGDAYDNMGLMDAIQWAGQEKKPIALLIEDNKQFRTVEIPYFDGPRYPHLAPIDKGRHSLDAILDPRK